MSWGTPIRITGDIYQTEFTANLSPIENGTLSISFQSLNPNLGYSTGQSALIISKSDPTNVFEAIITAISKTVGGIYTINLEQITNIKGSTFGNQTYILNLTGERGKSMINGTTGPTGTQGRIGDMFLNTQTGDLYIKS
jgi:hypothetical protein